eukprot:scaffold920_cov63-Phaeocystis_antarctica.AAC.7
MRPDEASPSFPASGLGNRTRQGRLGRKQSPELGQLAAAAGAMLLDHASRTRVMRRPSCVKLAVEPVRARCGPGWLPVAAIGWPLWIEDRRSYVQLLDKLWIPPLHLLEPDHAVRLADGAAVAFERLVKFLVAGEARFGHACNGREVVVRVPSSRIGLHRKDRWRARKPERTSRVLGT